jgi:hypothetical protein
MQEMKKDYTGFLKIKFDDIKPGDNTLYCNEWFIAFSTTQALKYGAPIVIAVINFIVTVIFDHLGDFQKSPSVNDRTQSTFQKLTIIQYFNIAVLTLIINMRVRWKLIEGWPVLNGDYQDFNVAWYKNIGAQLTFTLFINAFTPHLSKLAAPFIAKIKQCLDRGCKCSIYNEKTKAVNTKKLIQKDVEDLYVGPEIQAFFVYAQYFTSLWTIMSYSGGQPLLYIVGFLNYFVLYWVFKFLLVKFYKKTTAFNQELPITSIRYFRISLVFHFLLALVSFTNSNLLSANNIEFIENV